jgi:hypothetical protein
MDIDSEISRAEDRILHVWSIDLVDGHRRGRAIAELERRRREWETKRDETRREHEIALFDAEGERGANRKEFERRLAQEQMAHAEKLASQQIAAAESSAKATRMAAWAAGFSALGAVVSAAAAVVALLAHH